MARRAVLALTGLALAAAATVRTAGLATDDIYVTYRYAANLARGTGFVFNPGERVFGITDPGVGLVLAALHALTGAAIPLLGTALTGLALLASAALLALSCSTGERDRFPEALAGGLLLLTSGYLWTAQGSGPLPALALLLAAARLTDRTPGREPRDLAAGVLAGLAVWCRPDAALGAGALALLLAADRWRRRRLPWRYGAGLAAAVLPGLLAARLYFGTIVPQTLLAKRQAGALRGMGWEAGWAGAESFWGPAWDLFGFHAGPLAGVLALLGVLGLPALWRHGGRAGRLLVLHGLGIALAYTLLGVPFFQWYTVPPAALLLGAAPFGAGQVVRWARAGSGPLGRWLAPAAGAGAALLLAAVLAADWRWWRAPAAGDWRLPAYRAAGGWIRDHTPPGAEVALEEIGIVGYFGERPVRDLVGLVTPASLPYAARGDLLGAFLVRPSELVVFHTFTARGGTRPIVSRPWFARAYEEAARIEIAGHGGSVAIYRRRAGAAVPPSRPPRERRPGSSLRRPA